MSELPDNFFAVLATLYGTPSYDDPNFDKIVEKNFLAWNSIIGKWALQEYSGPDKIKSESAFEGYDRPRLTTYQTLRTRFPGLGGVWSGNQASIDNRLFELISRAIAKQPVDVFSEFKSEVHFERLVFPFDVALTHPKVSGRFRLCNCKFLASLDLTNCLIVGETRIEHCDFQEGFDLSGAEMRGGIWLMENQTESSSFLYECTISDQFSLYGGKYHGPIYFDESEFLGDVKIERAEFGEDIFFTDARASESFTIENCTFKRLANFYDFSTLDSVTIGNSRFQGDLVFTAGDDAERTDLELDMGGTKVEGRFDLQGRKFKTTPQISGLDVSGHVDVPTDETAWPKASSIDQATLLADMTTYETLRIQMNKQQRRGLELLFARREQDARLKLAGKRGDLATWLVLSAFKLFSDFGHSVRRPIFTLIILIVLATAIHSINDPEPSSPVVQEANIGFTPPTAPWASAVGSYFSSATFENSSRLAFAGFFVFAQQPRHGTLSTSELVTLSAHRGLSLLLWFLLGLAVRTRLRMN